MTVASFLNSDLVIANADALGLPWKGDFVKPNLPFSENLLGLYMFSKSESASLINYANPNLPLLKIGSPEFTPSGAVVSRGNGFDTQIVPTTDMTILLLMQPAEGLILNGSILVSTLTPAADAGTAFDRGDQLAVNSGNTGIVSFYCDRSGTALIQGVAGGIIMPATGPLAIIATRRSTNGADLAKAEGGNNTFNTTYGGTGANSRTIFNKTLRIGMNYLTTAGTAYSGEWICKGAAIYGNSYSIADLTTALNAQRTVATTVGMTI